MFGSDRDTMVQREEIPNVLRPLLLNTWDSRKLAWRSFGVQPRRGAYHDKWLATQPITLPQCDSVYKVDPRSYSWDLQRHINTPFHLGVYKMHLMIL